MERIPRRVPRVPCAFALVMTIAQRPLLSFVAQNGSPPALKETPRDLLTSLFIIDIA